MISRRKRAIVTGGSSGIGFGIAQALIEQNYDVIIVARNKERLQKATDRLGPHAAWRKADVANFADVDMALTELKQVDLLVNAAGFIRMVNLAMDTEEAEENWDAVLDANLKGSFLMSHAVYPLLTSPGGRIINISSIGAQTGGSRAGALAYAAAKSGLHGLTYALARECAPRGITVNTIAPGFVAETGFTGAWAQDIVDSIVQEIPIGRAGTPADVAGAVLWLASDAASFVTGTVIPVNGGWHMG